MPAEQDNAVAETPGLLVLPLPHQPSSEPAVELEESGHPVPQPPGVD